MNKVWRVAYAAAAGVLLMVACVEQKDVPNAESENMALSEWMRINRPELLENYQQQGDYYVDVLDEGDEQAKPLGDAASWVRFTFTGRNLAGDIALTRSEVEARLAGSYTDFTHYVPFFKYYSGAESNGALLEGTYLAMRNKLILGEKYAADRGLPREVEMRLGTKVTLYMPSSVVGVSGVGGSGGYEGQEGYELRSGCPFVVTMELTDTIQNPLKREGADVTTFMNDNGRLSPRYLPGMKPEQTKSRQARDVIFDPNDPYNDGFGWHYADTSKNEVYVDLTMTPTKKYNYPTHYQSLYAPYNNFDALEQNICDTLVRRFGDYAGANALPPADTVGMSGNAKIWYIGRLLDGFIFDTNIPGVRRLIYGEGEAKGKALDYKPEKDNMIKAFYFAVPRLRWGQWASILTTSTFAYGASGIVGQTNVSTSGGFDYSSYWNYMNMNNIMGGGYGGYYNDYYGSGMAGLYYNMGTTEQTTSTSISTEIQPFMPLLFEIYIEPQEEEE